MIPLSRLAVIALVALMFPLIGPGGDAAAPEPSELVCEKEHLPSVGMVCQLPNGLYLGHYDDGTPFTTHGADPMPDGGDTELQAVEERDPRCATDHYQHILYGRPASTPDRYDTYLPVIQRAVRHMNWILNEDALESGGVTADYKVLCDSTGTVRVDSFVVDSDSSEFSSVVNAARRAGFSAPNADYSIFFDGSSPGVCGVGHIAYDERLSEDNANNRGGDYAVTYKGCWTGRTPMHENGHNQGAVQRTAPMSDAAGHCLEGRDIMCYPTSNFLVLCGDRIHFDCRFDTYFDTEPETGDWLATHWNIGSRLNRFIAFGDTDPVPDNYPPFASFTVSAEHLDVTVDASPSFDPEDDPLTYTWDFGDGTGGTGQTTTHTYADGGSYIITLTVEDSAGGNHSTDTQIWVTPEVTARVETHLYEGRIGCSLAYAPVQSADQCDPPGEQARIPIPVGPGVSGVHVELRWDTDDATAGLAAERMSFGWIHPAGFGSGEGTSPVIGDHVVPEDDPVRSTGSNGAIEVRPSGRSGLVVDQGYSLCVVVLYSGAQATGTECQG